MTENKLLMDAETERSLNKIQKTKLKAFYYQIIKSFEYAYRRGGDPDALTMLENNDNINEGVKNIILSGTASFTDDELGIDTHELSKKVSAFTRALMSPDEKVREETRNSAFMKLFILPIIKGTTNSTIKGWERFERYADVAFTYDKSIDSHIKNKKPYDSAFFIYTSDDSTKCTIDFAKMADLFATLNSKLYEPKTELTNEEKTLLLETTEQFLYTLQNSPKFKDRFHEQQIASENDIYYKD